MIWYELFQINRKRSLLYGFLLRTKYPNGKISSQKLKKVLIKIEYRSTYIKCQFENKRFKSSIIIGTTRVKIIPFQKMDSTSRKEKSILLTWKTKSEQTNWKTKCNRKTEKWKAKQNRAARVEELLHLFSKCTCVNAIYFVPVCTSTYHMEHNMTWVIALNLRTSVSARVQVQSSNLHSTRRTCIWCYQMKEITSKLLHIYENCY